MCAFLGVCRVWSKLKVHPQLHMRSISVQHVIMAEDKSADKSAGTADAKTQNKTPEPLSSMKFKTRAEKLFYLRQRRMDLNDLKRKMLEEEVRIDTKLSEIMEEIDDIKEEIAHAASTPKQFQDDSEPKSETGVSQATEEIKKGPK